MKDNKKNVLMIAIDQFPRNRMQSTEGCSNMMPTLEFLSESGCSFDNAYSECPVCIPARRSLMTGLSPKSHDDRVYKDMLEMPDVPTLADCFRNSGYQTFAVGKMHVYPQRNRIGFDDIVLMEEGRNEFGIVDDYQIWLGEMGYFSDENMHAMGNNTYYTRPWHLPEQAHPTTWATKQMMKMIKRRDPGKPSLFYISYQSPHPPLIPLQPYLDMYELAEIDKAKTDDNWSGANHDAIKTLQSDGLQYSEKERALAKKAYYATCTQIDHQIRLLMGTLREANMLEDTIIVFFSDHGDCLFDHDIVGKRNFYEGSANIPLIFAGEPMLKYKGEDCTKLACLKDVMPTLLDLCDIEIPETVEGVALFGESENKSLYGEISEGRLAVRMIRDKDYKFIYYPNGNLKQLFDMKKDRLEKNNLADEAEYADVVARMEQMLIAELYNDDLEWIKDGKLVGCEYKKKQKFDFGLYNQRGSHWPLPGKYSNFGCTDANE